MRFADAYAVLQKITRFADAYSRDVIDKIYAGHFFECVAQVIGADVRELSNFRQRKFVIRMFVDKISRLPNCYWLSAFQA